MENREIKELTVRQSDVSVEPPKTLWSKKLHQNFLCSSGDMANFAQVDARAAQNPAETAWTNPNISRCFFLGGKKSTRHDISQAFYAQPSGIGYRIKLTEKLFGTWVIWRTFAIQLLSIPFYLVQVKQSKVPIHSARIGNVYLQKISISPPHSYATEETSTSFPHAHPSGNSNQASYISLNSLVLQNPPPQEIPIPSLGGVWIFSGPEQCWSIQMYNKLHVQDDLHRKRVLLWLTELSHLWDHCWMQTYKWIWKVSFPTQWLLFLATLVKPDILVI